MKILGIGSAVPAREVSNVELQQFLDTSDEWISTRTGIKSRRVITDETLLGMGTDAGKRALQSAGLDASEMDYLICTTATSDYTTPGLGCMLTGALDMDCPAVDLNAACAGFVYALDMADSYFRAGKAKRILIISAEANTRLCDWTDRSTCVLFGDGVGACVVGDGEGHLSSRLTAKADDQVLVGFPNPGNSPYAKDHQHPYQPLFMAGQDVYKFAVSSSVKDILAVCEDAGITSDQVDMFVLHQANKRIIDAAQQRLKQPESKFPHNIERTGNTSSASIPILLDELDKSGQLKPGMTLAFSAFGAGLTTGACIIKWTKEQSIT